MSRISFPLRGVEQVERLSSGRVVGLPYIGVSGVRSEMGWVVMVVVSLRKTLIRS